MELVGSDAKKTDQADERGRCLKSGAVASDVGIVIVELMGRNVSKITMVMTAVVSEWVQQSDFPPLFLGGKSVQRSGGR